MYMRLKGNRWYLQKKVGGKFKGYSLKAHKDDLATAYKNLGVMLDRIERGDDPGAGRWKISQIKYTPKSEREESILRGPLVEWFGALRVSEVTEESILDYVKSRKGKTKSTLSKELRVLKNICQEVNSKFALPQISYENKGKQTTRALTTMQVQIVVPHVRKQSQEFGDQYLKVFKILAWTGMDVKDVVFLRWEYIEDGWIRRSRFKSGNPNPIPVCKPLADLLGKMVRNLDGKLFHGITPRATATAIRRAFQDAGVKGSARSLRHYAASFMASNGATDSVVGQALGHSKGSRCTALYIHASEEDLKNAYKPFDQVAL